MSKLTVVARGCDPDQGLLDAALSVLIGDGAHPSASIVSNSWQIPLGSEPEQVMHAIDLRAAAEGVGMYFVSGDTPGLTMTGSDPYATVVGGTALGIGGGGGGSNAGTSLACPLIAGLVADAQQGQPSAFGFINPLLYRLSGTSAFHDILPVSASTPQQDRAAFIAGLQKVTGSRPPIIVR